MFDNVNIAISFTDAGVTYYVRDIKEYEGYKECPFFSIEKKAEIGQVRVIGKEMFYVQYMYRSTFYKYAIYWASYDNKDPDYAKNFRNSILR